MQRERDTARHPPGLLSVGIPPQHTLMRAKAGLGPPNAICSGKDLFRCLLNVCARRGCALVFVCVWVCVCVFVLLISNQEYLLSTPCHPPPCPLSLTLSLSH